MRSLFLPILLLSTLFIATACNSKKKMPPSSTGQQLPDTLTVHDAWARVAAQGANSAAYFSITNTTAAADTLLGIQTDAAKMAEIHESYKGENGMMGMRPADTIIIQPDSSFILKPGSYHLMLMQLTHKLTKGDSLQLSLEFAVSGTYNITIPIQQSN